MIKTTRKSKQSTNISVIPTKVYCMCLHHKMVAYYKIKQILYLGDGEGVIDILCYCSAGYQQSVVVSVQNFLFKVVTMMANLFPSLSRQKFIHRQTILLTDDLT